MFKKKLYYYIKILNLACVHGYGLKMFRETGSGTECMMRTVNMKKL